ncbi:hypothetical protein B0J11DRAFT_507295 [Dendryphion nanum]|uniref:Uncharacterized protein n=1 Tax=Dendryphion nanum TaxID=256645 RepID=A0A9P9IIZ6_9PLEO|nr:hypothetical protein B0J11DRAFT_507295 [Dendryphion nanum]
MFLPRALRLKGIKPAETHSAGQATKSACDEPAPQPQQDKIQADPEPVRINDTSKTISTSSKPLSATKITPEYLGQVLSGVELLFSDYAHQEPEAAKWLQNHYRVVNGEINFVHLSAILEHPNITSLKPTATQPILIQALQNKNSNSLLEVSENGYHVRREPSSYPLRFIPQDSFDVTNDAGISFWDERTIYVEPHIRNLCQTPAKVAWWLEQHGEMRDKWFPIQAVHTLYNSCAFVVLSGNVNHEGLWKKWRGKNKPNDWKIMSRLEHTKRTNEYLELLRRDNPKMLEQKRKKRLELEQDSTSDFPSRRMRLNLSTELSRRRTISGSEAGQQEYNIPGPALNKGPNTTIPANPKKRKRVRKHKRLADEHQATSSNEDVNMDQIECRTLAES